MLALLMAVLMTISLFPLQTFAADGEEPEPVSQTADAVQETDKQSQTGDDTLPDASEEATEEDNPTEEISVLAEGTIKNNGTTYRVTSDGVLTLGGSGTVPSFSNTTPPWYSYSGTIRSIVIESGVKQLGSSGSGMVYSAFYGLTNVTDVTVPGPMPNLYEIGIFTRLTALERVHVLAQYYGTVAATFSYAGRMNNPVLLDVTDDTDDFVIRDGVLICYQGNAASVSIPETVTKIGKGAFMNRVAVTDLEIPETVTEIQEAAFYGCSGLSGDLCIPGSVTSIGVRSFYNCRGFDGMLRLPSSVKSIGSYAFYQCGCSGPLVLPDSLTAINENTFYGMSHITSITFGANLKSFASNSFAYCSALQEVTFPGLTPPTFGGFPNCSNLHVIYVPSVAYRDYNAAIGSNMPSGAVLRCSDYDKDFLADDGTLIAYLGEAEEIVFPTDVTITEIADGAFQNLKTVKSITIPEGVTKIGAKAFQNAAALQEIRLPSTLSEIGSEAFSDCTSLTAITIPEGVTEISSAMFRNSGITEIGLPSTLEKIGSEAFSGCKSLTALTLPEGLTSLGEKAFYNCSALSGSVSVPGGVKTIPAYAFSGCSALTGLTLAEGIQGIGDYAFSGCGAMTGELVIPSTVTTIGQNAFYGCSQLTKLTLQEGLQSIGAHAFRNCSKLSGTLVIPNSVTRVDMNAFYD